MRSIKDVYLLRYSTRFTNNCEGLGMTGKYELVLVYSKPKVGRVEETFTFTNPISAQRKLNSLKKPGIRIVKAKLQLKKVR